MVALPEGPKKTRSAAEIEKMIGRIQARLDAIREQGDGTADQTAIGLQTGHIALMWALGGTDEMSMTLEHLLLGLECIDALDDEASEQVAGHMRIIANLDVSEEEKMQMYWAVIDAATRMKRRLKGA